jgi:hypothetical protein
MRDLEEMNRIANIGMILLQRGSQRVVSRACLATVKRT